jgi:hypothetical protein
MTCYITPLIFFILPSLTNPGGFEKVSIDKLPHTKQVIETSQDETFKKFRNYWKVQSHVVCQKNHGPHYCAEEILVTMTDIYAKCFQVPLR